MDYNTFNLYYEQCKQLEKLKDQFQNYLANYPALLLVRELIELQDGDYNRFVSDLNKVYAKVFAMKKEEFDEANRQLEELRNSKEKNKAPKTCLSDEFLSEPFLEPFTLSAEFIKEESINIDEEYAKKNVSEEKLREYASRYANKAEKEVTEDNSEYDDEILKEFASRSGNRLN